MIEFVDERGRKMRYKMSDEEADVAYTADEIAEIGVNVGVPDLDRVDWEKAITALHNKLYDTHLFTMDDVIQKEGLLSKVILSIFKAKIANLYSEGES